MNVNLLTNVLPTFGKKNVKNSKCIDHKLARKSAELRKTFRVFKRGENRSSRYEARRAINDLLCGRSIALELWEAIAYESREFRSAVAARKYGGSLKQ